MMSRALLVAVVAACLVGVALADNLVDRRHFAISADGFSYEEWADVAQQRVRSYIVSARSGETWDYVLDFKAQTQNARWCPSAHSLDCQCQQSNLHGAEFPSFTADNVVTASTQYNISKFELEPIEPTLIDDSVVASWGVCAAPSTECAHQLCEDPQERGLLRGVKCSICKFAIGKILPKLCGWGGRALCALTVLGAEACAIAITIVCSGEKLICNAAQCPEKICHIGHLC